MTKRVVLENKEILDSWKEISKYLGRDIRTCFRWEKELGLPVHRIDSTSSRSKVFAYKSEINKWLKEKANDKEIQKKSFFENKRIIVGLLSSFILLSIIFAFLYFAHIIPFATSTEIPSIAVLPFKNLNASEFEGYFSPGITNAIIDHLAILNNLKVVSSRSTSKYRNSDKSPKEIGEELGVSYVLEGNVEKADRDIKLAVQFFSIRDNTNIWSKEYEEGLDNIFYIQGNIISNISKILNLSSAENLSIQTDSRRPFNYQVLDTYMKGNYILDNLNGENENQDPWALYYQGKYYWGKSARENNELAIRIFNEAIKIDSNFAEAYLGLSRCYTNFVNFNWDKDERNLEQAENLVQKAQEISPGLPEYYSNLTEIYLLKDFIFEANAKDIAFEIAQEGIDKYPNHPQLNSIFGYCYFTKYGEKGNKSDFEKALEHKEKSFWLDPNSIHNLVYAELLMLDKEYSKAMHICNNIRQISPDYIDFRLAEIYYYMGDLENSKVIFQQFESPLDFKTGALFYLGMIASQGGEKENVLKILGEISLLVPRRSELKLDHLKLASIYFGLGIKDMGYKYLQSFFNENIAKKAPYIFVKYIDIDKNFDIFKEEKKFKKIIKGAIEWQEANPSE
ncbi:MAG: hypothetical protein JSV96_05280 [Candidatus Aminicenantes bacterium]|nr:MAG: hypothetical protein JSV96_05280 [Candidatus Aminicenantes bacterium]